MHDFEALLADIANRPAVYVGTCSLRAISHYLNGYSDALKDAGFAESPLASWQRWVKSRYLISHAGWHWARILLHIFGSDDEAIRAMPDLYRQFLIDRSSVGPEGIEVEHKRRFLENFGQDWYEPPRTKTIDAI